MKKAFIEDIIIINSSWSSYASCIDTYKVAAIVSVGGSFKINVGLINIEKSLDAFSGDKEYYRNILYNYNTNIKEYDLLETVFEFNKDLFNKAKIVKEQLRDWIGCKIESDELNNVIIENESYFSGYISGNYSRRYRLRVPKKLTNSIRFAITGNRGSVAMMQDVKINEPLEKIVI